MTCNFVNGTSFVLTDIGDTFTVDPMLIFMRDGKEVSVSDVIPLLQSIDIQEDNITDTYSVELTSTNGPVAILSFPSLETIAECLISVINDSLWVYDDGMLAIPYHSSYPVLVHASKSYAVISGCNDYLWFNLADDSSEVDPPYQLTYPVFHPVLLHGDERLRFQNIDEVKAYLANQHVILAYDKVSIFEFEKKCQCGLVREVSIVLEYCGKTVLYWYGLKEYTKRYLDYLSAVGHIVVPAKPGELAPPKGDDCLDFKDVTSEYLPAAEPAANKVDRRTMKRILSASKNLIKRCDKYAKLKREGLDDLAEVEYGDIVTMGSSLQLEPIGYMALEMWDDINARAADAADGKYNPRYYGYVAAEYIKWASGLIDSTSS